MTEFQSLILLIVVGSLLVLTGVQAKIVLPFFHFTVDFYVAAAGLAALVYVGLKAAGVVA